MQGLSTCDIVPKDKRAKLDPRQTAGSPVALNGSGHPRMQHATQRELAHHNKAVEVQTANVEFLAN